MTTDSTDPLARVRADLARLRTIIADETHWVFLTDDARATQTLRASAGSDALFVEALINFIDRGDVFPLAVLAVSKKAWSPSAAVRVAGAAAGRRAPDGDSNRVRDGADIFPISRDPDRLVVVLEQIRSGTLSCTPPTEGE
jgi:hypothetical protein